MCGERLEIHEDGLTLGGEPFYIVSGDMQYFRFFRDGWERRLKLMKDFGLTCVQTYVPWNLHEPRKGEFHFEGNLDLVAFIRMAGEMGLKVMLRPAPYMCAEWDMGGMPSWLLRDRSLCLRTREAGYMKHLRDYYARLMSEVTPLQSTHGGPIIAMALENEYGSFGNDLEYIRQVAEMMREMGVEVPLYTANGISKKHLTWGAPAEFWAAGDCPATMPGDREIMEEHQGKKPLYIAEEWGGRAQLWGGYFNRKPVAEAAADYRRGLEAGFMINLYMFCGGTSFGFMAGANYGVFRQDVPDARQRYTPFTTSYDTDAPVSEDGQPTEKYFALKKVLADYVAAYHPAGYRGTPARDEQILRPESQEIGRVELTQAAPLLENADTICSRKVLSPNVKCMEDLGQDYGFILYSTFIPHTDDCERVLQVKNLADRVTAYGNGSYLGCLMRDRSSDSGSPMQDGGVRFRIPAEGLHLQLLVENMGRVCYGFPLLFDRKGIERCVHLERIGPDGKRMHDISMLMNWTIHTLPMTNLNRLAYTGAPADGLPGFYAGRFKARAGVDTFLKLEGWNKGIAFVNGFNLGRYWHIGPQKTLYVPGELLQEENTLLVFEIHQPNPSHTVQLVGTPELDGLTENVEAIRG